MDAWKYSNIDKEIMAWDKSFEFLQELISLNIDTSSLAFDLGELGMYYSILAVVRKHNYEEYMRQGFIQFKTS